MLFRAISRKFVRVKKIVEFVGVSVRAGYIGIVPATGKRLPEDSVVAKG